MKINSNFSKVGWVTLLGAILALNPSEISAQSFRLSGVVALEKNSQGGLAIVCSGFKLDKIGFGSGGNSKIGPDQKFTVDTKTSSMKIVGSLVDYKDKDKFATYESEIKNLDGTNAIYRSEVTYVQDHNSNAGHSFIFDIPGSPASSMYEIVDANGRSHSFQAAKQEIQPPNKELTLFKAARRVTIRKGSMLMTIEPGKDCTMQIQDPRLRDKELGYIMVSVYANKLAPNPTIPKGSKEVVETKITTGFNVPQKGK